MIIFHIDANSAYLSWSAAALLEAGWDCDLRRIPAVIGGSEASRHGIVLAKSIPAKALGIRTGETLYEARQKCPGLLVHPPDYDLYMACSAAMYDILQQYSSLIQRYSIDECFLDYTASVARLGPPLEAARRLASQIRSELGFTVNVGISTNKLLAKMASELEKPDRVHTLYPEEVPLKLWPLPVSDLFMVGRATRRKLARFNIQTIGDLARADRRQLQAMLKSHGDLVWRYANGLDTSPVIPNDRIVQKGLGNSTTLSYDVTDPAEIRIFLLSLSERVGMRLRKLGCRASRVSVWLKTDAFEGRSHQRQLGFFTDETSVIYRTACQLLEECAPGEPLRQLGLGLGRLAGREWEQLELALPWDEPRPEPADACVDDIRDRWGERAIMRGVFVNSPFKPLEGGVNEGQFLTMGGYGP